MAQSRSAQWQKGLDGESPDLPLMLRGGNWSILGAGGIPLPLTGLLLNDCSGVDGDKAPGALINGF